MIDSSRFLPRFLTIAFGLTLTIQTGTGQDLTWDVGSGDGATVTDGTGTWTDLNGNWNDGATDATWNNGLPNNAIFGGGTSGTAGLVTLGSSITTGSLTFNPPSAGSYTIDTSTFGLTLNGNVVANTSALIQSGGGGGLTLGTSIDWNVASGEEVTVSSIIGGGANGITKSGEGTLILSGTNTFTGRAQVDGGTLRVVDNAITTSNANAIREYGPIADGAVLEFQYNGVPEFNNTGIVNLSGDGTFRKTGSATLTQISGGATIAMGSDALIHIAEGTYAFGAQGVGNWNSNLSDFRVDAGATYQGGATPTIVDAIDGAGTIIVGGGNGTSTVGNGFTMGVDGGSGTFSGTLTNSGAYGPNSIRKEGGGTQILSGNNDYNGITTIIGGVLQIGDGVAATGTLGTGDTVNNASLVFNHTGNHTYAGSISGTGTVTKNGSGFQALNGDNTYGSPTQVNAGTLNIGGTNTSTFTIANGANFGGEGSTTGDLIFQGTHTVTTDADPAAALTTSGQLNLDLVPAGGITLDITGFGSGEIVLINYGTLSGLPAAGNFTLGSHTPSNRLVGAPTIQDNGSGSITTNLGYVVNTWQGNDPTNANFWDVNTTANWSNSSPDSVFHTNDDVVFGDSAASFNPTLQSSLSAASVTFENDSNAYTLSDLGAGVETLTIVNALNLTGDAEVTLDATIVSNGPAAISGGGNVTISQPFAINGGLNISGSGDVTISGLLSGTTELVKSGTGTTLITGDNNGYTGVMTVNAGTLALQNTAINNSRTYGPIAQGATLEFRMNAGGADPANLNISGAGTFLKTGNQTLSQISANNSIAMDSGGLFHLAEGAYIFGAGGIGFWNQNLGDLLMGPGTTFTGSATPIQFDAVNGEGTMSFGGGLTLGVDDGDGTFTGAIIDTAVNLNSNTAIRNSIVKNGSGTQVLSGANSYSGTTTINGGLLILNGTLGGDINVADGANIGGEASTAGNLTFLGGAHTLEVDSNTPGALGSTGAGGLDISSMGTGGLTVNISGTGPAPVSILTYGSGGLNGGLDIFNLGSHNLSGRVGSAGAFMDTGSAITIDLGFAARTWNNSSTDGFWNEGAGSSANWVEGDNLFFDFDSVVFDDTLSGAQVVTMADSVNATRVLFNNSTGNDYTLNGNGGNVLAISEVVTFQGSGNVTLNPDLVGAASIVQSGTGTTTLNGGNTLAGGTTITNGTLRAGSATALGSGSVSLNDTGAVLEVTDGVAIANPILIGNTGGVKTVGLASGATSGTMSGPIVSSNTTGGNFQLSADTGGTLSLTGIISGTGGIEKVGLGTVELTGLNTFGGQTVVTQGTLRLVNDAIGNGGLPYNIAQNAILEINRTVGNPFLSAIDWSGGGTFLKTGAGGFTQTSAGGDVAFSSGALIHIAEGTYQFGGGGIGDWSTNLSDFRVDAGARYIAGATPTVVDAVDGGGTIEVGGSFTLGVDNGSGTFTGVFTDGGFGAGSPLIKQGNGTQTLSGANNYTGPTNINGGLLVLEGALTGDITVASGANIGGEATTQGILLFQGTSHTLDINAATPGALGSAGTGSTNVSALSAGGLTVNVTGTGPGAIPVLGYGSGGFTGAVDRFALGTHTPSARLVGPATFVDNGTDAITIDLGYVTNTWVGDETNATFWDVATTENWSNSADAGLFQQGDDAVFDDTASNFNPTLQANITAGTVNFTNDTENYTVDAVPSVGLMTHGAVNLAGNANVTLNVDVDATGGVNSTGAGTMAITGAISGAGDFVQSGAGQSTLSGANAYTGSTRVSAGTLLAAADHVIPDGSQIIHTGGDLNMNGRTDTLHSIVQTGGDFELRGADITLLNNSSLTNLTGNSGQSVVRLVDGVTLTSIGGISQLGDNVRIAFDTQGSSLADISASINTGDGNGSIDKLGTGTLRLTSNASAYGGGNRFENGLVEFTSIANRDTPSSLGDADFEDVLQIGSNATPATLRMIGTAGGSTSDRAVQLGDAGATIEVAESSRVLTLNGVISNHNTSGSLTTGGQGSIVFGGANTYDGTTTVASGTLQVGVGGTGQTGSGAVTAQSGSTILGSGTVRGSSFTLDNGATLRPGDGVGNGDHATLSFMPNAASGSTSSLNGDIILGITTATATDATYGGNVFGSAGYNSWVDSITGVGSHDLLSFNNPDSGTGYNLDFLTNLTGSLQVVGDGFTPEQGQVFNLLDWGTLVTENFTGFDTASGTMIGNGDEGTDLDLPDLSGFGLSWDFSRFVSSGNIVVVPEPSRGMLMLAGLFAWILRRRRA